jgi:hypothetical protein
MRGITHLAHNQEIAGSTPAPAIEVSFKSPKRSVIFPLGGFVLSETKCLTKNKNSVYWAKNKIKGDKMITDEAYVLPAIAHVKKFVRMAGQHDGNWRVYLDDYNTDEAILLTPVAARELFYWLHNYRKFSFEPQGYFFMTHHFARIGAVIFATVEPEAN